MSILFAIIETEILYLEMNPGISVAEMDTVKSARGCKKTHVPNDITFTAVGIINIPSEKELLSAMEEMRNKPLQTA